MCSESCYLCEQIITHSRSICQPRRPQKYQKPLINTPQVVDNNSQVFYNSPITPWSTLMSVSYQSAQKQHVRITLDLSVLSDFNARDIDFSKLFELEPSENVEVYIEEFDRY